MRLSIPNTPELFGVMAYVEKKQGNPQTQPSLGLQTLGRASVFTSGIGMLDLSKVIGVLLAAQSRQADSLSPTVATPPHDRPGTRARKEGVGKRRGGEGRGGGEERRGKSGAASCVGAGRSCGRSGPDLRLLAAGELVLGAGGKDAGQGAGSPFASPLVSPLLLSLARPSFCTASLPPAQMPRLSWPFRRPTDGPAWNGTCCLPLSFMAPDTSSRPPSVDARSAAQVPRSASFLLLLPPGHLPRPIPANTEIVAFAPSPNCADISDS